MFWLFLALSAAILGEALWTLKSVAGFRRFFLSPRSIPSFVKAA